MSKGYHFIAPGSVLVDHGPVHMTISAWRRGRPAGAAAASGAKTALHSLQVLSQYLEFARQSIKQLNLTQLPDIPPVLQRMIQAVAQLNQDDVTPMAAVAGAFADMAKEQVVSKGADRVIANNGGDIAFCRGQRRQPLRIGMVADLASGIVTHIVDLPAGSDLAHVEGIATSGFGGRSLTKGVASAVTCFAKNSALADAAATAVANATSCDHSEIERCPAEMIDPWTDIRGHRVTCHIGSLSPAAISQAMAGGLERARQLYSRETIAAAIIFIRNQLGIWPPNFARFLRVCQD